MIKGDYVLASKYKDGDPNDQFCVGFYDREERGRHYVVDASGKQFRMNGFRRVEKISESFGKLFVSKIKLLNETNTNIWYWKYHPKQLRKLK